MKMNKIKRLIYKYRFFLIIVYFLILLLPFIIHIASNQDILGDEGYWINSGNTYLRLFIKCDFNNDFWFNYHFEDWSWMNPQLGKYIIGLPFHLTGYGNQDFNYSYSWDKDAYWNTKNSNLPTENILIIGRIPGLIMGYLCCIILFLIALRINWVVAVLTSSYLAFNKYFLTMVIRAMNDAPYIFFSLLSIYFLLLFNDQFDKNEDNNKMIYYALLIAVFVSLVISTKYIGGITLLFVFSFLAVLFFINLKKSNIFINKLRLHCARNFKLLMFSIIILIVIIPSLFFLLNPQFHRHPVDMLKQTFDFWEYRNLEHQNAVPDTALTTISERFIAVNKFIFIDKTTTNIFFKLSFSLELIFYLFGAFVILIQKNKTMIILLFWSIFTFIIYYLWLPLNWDRYLLLAFITTPIIISFGFFSLMTQYGYNFFDYLIKKIKHPIKNKE